MIIVGSRYQDGHLQAVLKMGRDAGTTTLAVFRGQEEQRAARSRVRYRSGERWDHLALNTIGSSQDWWRILDANDEIIDPFSVSPGTEVSLP